ncbi:hypothetical protein [Salinimicrobium sp. GXAS 041]|uniref:hypothetical protein n=1 Tax=Salinimicrobium sp. GXAS 041 TaxID=3400806 RepID=UPI003C76649A
MWRETVQEKLIFNPFVILVSRPTVHYDQKDMYKGEQKAVKPEYHFDQRVAIDCS